MLTQIKWVIVASRTQVKIFEHDELTTQLKCLQVIPFDDGRLQAREFGQDRLGARKARMGLYSGKNTAMGGGKDPHEHAAEKFALNIANKITKSFQENLFIRAVVFAEPHFMGLIKQNLHAKAVAAIEWIPKDLAKATTPDLERHLAV